MRRALLNIYRLGLKELSSLRSDLVMVVLIVFTFTIAVYTVSQHAQTEIRNASVAVVDADHSQLSARIRDAILPPYFSKPVEISMDEIDRVMDTGRFTFVLVIPDRFQARLAAGRSVGVQINVDATAMTQAGQGVQSLQQIISQQVARFRSTGGRPHTEAARLVVRTKFNPNRNSKWFLAVMQLTNMITLLAVLLTGAALIREREQGTIEHLLVMPVSPVEIMLAKVWANGLVIVVAALLSLLLVVEGVLGVPVAGSIPLFALATVLYLFSVTALGIYLATLARSMPQFGLLVFPVFIVMNLLSGSITPLDSMPTALQYLMRVSPSTHYVAVTQGILYRGAGLDTVWQQLLIMSVLGGMFFTAALLRFRRMLVLMQ